MNIQETFLNLTKRTYPHGTENELFHLLPENIQTDEFGNKFLLIGDKPTTMFTSHLDTASYNVVEVNHIIKDNIIHTDGSSILGADDKAGVTLMLFMIKNNIEGLYYFFLGEESGCIGSRKVADLHYKTPIPTIKKVISFDRRGTNSIITHQLGSRCCSDTFAESLANELNNNEVSFNYRLDSTGIYTDSAQFTHVYSECTNISVGYQNEHTSAETQNIKHLELLANALIKVNWENLLISRNNSDFETDDFELDPIWDREYEEQDNQNKNRWTSEYYFQDDEHENYNSSVKINNNTKEYLNTNFAKSRLNYELKLIETKLKLLEVDFTKLEWDGTNLDIYQQHTGHNEVNREELEEIIYELKFWKDKI